MPVTMPNTPVFDDHVSTSGCIYRRSCQGFPGESREFCDAKNTGKCGTRIYRLSGLVGAHDFDLPSGGTRDSFTHPRWFALRNADGHLLVDAIQSGTFYSFPYAALPLDFGWALIEQGIGGLIIGLIYGTSTGDSKDVHLAR